VTGDDLYDYDQLIVPACAQLTAGQVAALHAYLTVGGHVVHTGDLGEPSLREHPNVCAAAPDELDRLLPYGRQVEVAGSDGIATNVMRLPDGRSAVHVINYGYDAEADRVRPFDADLTVRLPRRHTHASAYFCDGRVTAPDVRAEEHGRRHTVALEALGPYAIVVFS
jgi:hypothetical protein